MLPSLAPVPVPPLIAGGADRTVTATFEGESPANVPLTRVTVPATVLGVGVTTNGGRVPLISTLFTAICENPAPASTVKSARPVRMGTSANENLPSRTAVWAVNVADRVT